MNVAILGGSFNPPHICHIFVTQYVLATTDVEQVWFLPCYQHAFGKPLAPFEHRLALCRLAVSSFRENVVNVFSFEQERQGPSWTIDTVRYLKQMFPDFNFRWIIGSDVLYELDKWKDFDQLVELISFVIVLRSGSESPVVSLRQSLRQAQDRTQDAAQLVAQSPVTERCQSMVTERRRSTTRASKEQQTLLELYEQCQELAQQGIQLPNVSSSQIRERVKRHLSIDHLVPHAVKAYIEKHSLYKDD